MIPPDIAKIIVLRKKKNRASFFFCRALRIKSQVKQYFISLIFAHSQKNKFQLINSLISPRYNLFELPHKNIFAFLKFRPRGSGRGSRVFTSELFSSNFYLFSASNINSYKKYIYDSMFLSASWLDFSVSQRNQRFSIPFDFSCSSLSFPKLNRKKRKNQFDRNWWKFNKFEVSRI